MKMMKNNVHIQDYKDVSPALVRSLNYNYLRHDSEISHMSTETGDSSELIVPPLNLSDSIFSELPVDVLNNQRVRPFLIALYYAFISHQKGDYTYLPLTLGEKDDNSIVLDWIYETVRFSFFFMKDKDVYSITRYDTQKNSFSQKIEDLPANRYKEIASQVVQAIA